MSRGFTNSAYGMSKVGVSALSEIQHRLLSADPRDDIIVNACCPGYVYTDMTSQIDQGADTPLYLALLWQKLEYNVKLRIGEENQDFEWIGLVYQFKMRLVQLIHVYVM
jgi:NAD(P)-dependent dehydrogenase (short-subunit alcohol dehydrogenase family)